MVLSSSFPQYMHKYLQRSLQQFADPLLHQDVDPEAKITEFKKTWMETSGDYFKAVTVLPQMLVGIIHFSNSGGFPEFYTNTYDINIIVCGVLGEGAALMYEIYRAMYYDPRWSQIYNYSITTYVFYQYGVHKAMPIFIWKQNWLFLSIPILCICRMKLIRKDAKNRALALLLTFVLLFIVCFRLYTIYRLIDMIRLHEKPLLIIMSLEASIEIFWLYCFSLSIVKSCKDDEVTEVLRNPCFYGIRLNTTVSDATMAEEVEEPNYKLRKFTTNQGAGYSDVPTGEIWHMILDKNESTQGP